MEIHPERFLNEAYKYIRSSFYGRGNKNALRLIEMSKGNNAIQNPVKNTPPVTSQYGCTAR